MKPVLPLLTAFILLGSGWRVSAQQAAFPSYETVTQRFCEHYRWPADVHISPVKRADGWHITEIRYADGQLETVKDQLFWNRETDAWLSPKYPAAAADEDRSEACGRILQRKNYLYDVSPYYGYGGWYRDVIEELGGRDHLPDTLLYALGKAYYENSAALLGNQYGFASEKDRLSNRPFPPDALSEQTLAAYGEMARKDIATYRRLAAQNPDFETFIGNLSQQIGNEHMSHWMSLYVWQNEAAARPFVEPGLYDAFTLDLAHNFLASCPQNAILFSNGDNDTYPLLYLQQQQGFRTDVTVLNMSMLAWSPYVLALSDVYGLFTKSVAARTLKDPRFGYILLEKDREISGGKLGKKLSKTQTQFGPCDYLPGDRIRLKTRKNGPQIDLGFNNGFLLADELMLLDIVSENLGKRPLCFTQTSTPDATYVPYLYRQGLVWVLGFARDGSSLAERPYANLAEDAALLATDFRLGPYPAEKLAARPNQNFIANYRFTYGECAMALLMAGNSAAAETLVDRVENAFPLARFELSPHTFAIAEAYVQLGRNEEALRYIEALETTVEKSWDEETRSRYLEELQKLRDSMSR